MKVRNALYTFVGAGLLAASASSAPIAFNAQVGLGAEDGSSYDELILTQTRSAAPGAVTRLEPLDTSFASAVDVTYDVVTTGAERAVTITYSTVDGSPFVTPAAVATLVLPDPPSRYTLFFTVNFQDPEWIGGLVDRDPALFGDGQVIVDPPGFSGGSFFTPSSHGFADNVSPAESGFFGADVIADAFSYTVTYAVVPEPASLLALAFGLVLVRRR